MTETVNKWNMICKSIPTYALSDQIGLDTETSYLLDLTTKENFKVANEYLKEKCIENFELINSKYIGKKVIIEYSTNGGNCGDWYCNHGTIDEYFENARKTLEEYLN